jgi:UDP-sulfoquinovose synthase
MKRVLILGIDGYIGWALAHNLLNDRYKVFGLDNLSRRTLVQRAGSESLTPIPCITVRERYLKSYENYHDSIACIDLGDHYNLCRVLEEFSPDTIVHLAEQPSAPWSMRSAADCISTQVNNVKGTLSLLWAMKKICPEAHLLKLGTMGEYGTPNCDIPEGEIPEQCLNPFLAHDLAYANEKCPMAGLMFPRTAGSFYHLSKVHDTHNIHFACRAWDLRSTDVMQGVVFGVKVTGAEDDMQITRFDYDQYFGTVINRFCVQAIIGMPLTIYGEGNQTRGYLPLKDSIKCLRLAIDNPPALGEYRTFNQLENIYSINALAAGVIAEAADMGISVTVKHWPNPRAAIELQNHYYNPTYQRLFDLGYEPSFMLKSIRQLLEDIYKYRDKVDVNCIIPTTSWR